MDEIDDMERMDMEDKKGLGGEKLIPKHGGYRKLKSFQMAQLVYDVTVRFCDRYVKSLRMREQMIQAARSGSQNIAEGSQVSGTSKKSELKLTGVARASLEELRVDYMDFLRQKRLPLWDEKDQRRLSLVQYRPSCVEQVADWIMMIYKNGRYGRNRQYGPAQSSIPSISSRSSSYPEIAANAALILIGVTCALLDRQMASQEKAFEKEGGFTERLYRVRQQARKIKSR